MRLVVSNQSPASRARAYSAGSAGTSATATSGIAWRTCSRSAGLSSKKTKLSRPRLSVSAMRRMVVPLGSQLISAAAMSSSRRIMSGFFSNGSRPSAGLFLEASARTIPRLDRRLDVLLKGAEGLAVGALSQRDAQGAGLADDTAPERVVQVEDQHLLGAGGQRPDARPEMLGQPNGSALTEGLFGPVVAPRVVERLSAHHAGDQLEVEEVGAGGAVPRGRRWRRGRGPRTAGLARQAVALGPGRDPVVADLENARAHPAAASQALRQKASSSSTRSATVPEPPKSAGSRE